MAGEKEAQPWRTGRSIRTLTETEKQGLRNLYRQTDFKGPPVIPALFGLCMFYMGHGDLSKARDEGEFEALPVGRAERGRYQLRCVTLFWGSFGGSKCPQLTGMVRYTERAGDTLSRKSVLKESRHRENLADNMEVYL
ncbi:MAG TPA: hypothetical protein VLY63_29045 [Anaerolineae bacterium]|nr:hypothetical protein [Anaerolineae bacterium]